MRRRRNNRGSRQRITESDIRNMIREELSTLQEKSEFYPTHLEKFFEEWGDLSTNRLMKELGMSLEEAVSEWEFVVNDVGADEFLNASMNGRAFEPYERVSRERAGLPPRSRSELLLITRIIANSADDADMLV